MINVIFLFVVGKGLFVFLWYQLNSGWLRLAL